MSQPNEETPNTGLFQTNSKNSLFQPNTQASGLFGTPSNFLKIDPANSKTTKSLQSQKEGESKVSDLFQMPDLKLNNPFGAENSQRNEINNIFGQNKSNQAMFLNQVSELDNKPQNKENSNTKISEKEIQSLFKNQDDGKISNTDFSAPSIFGLKQVLDPKAEISDNKETNQLKNIQTQNTHPFPSEQSPIIQQKIHKGNTKLNGGDEDSQRFDNLTLEPSNGSDQDDDSDMMNFQGASKVKQPAANKIESKNEDDDDESEDLGDFGKIETKVREVYLESGAKRLQYTKIDQQKLLIESELKNEQLQEEAKSLKLSNKQLIERLKESDNEKEAMHKQFNEEIKLLQDKIDKEIEKRIKDNEEADKLLGFNRFKLAILRRNSQIQYKKYQSDEKYLRIKLEDEEDNHNEITKELKQELFENQNQLNSSKKSEQEWKSKYLSLLGNLRFAIGNQTVSQNEVVEILKQKMKDNNEQQQQLSEIERINVQLRIDFERVEVQNILAHRQLEEQKVECYRLEQQNTKFLAQIQANADNRITTSSQNSQAILEAHIQNDKLSKSTELLQKQNNLLQALVAFLGVACLVIFLAPSLFH